MGSMAWSGRPGSLNRGTSPPVQGLRCHVCMASGNCFQPTSCKAEEARYCLTTWNSESLSSWQVGDGVVKCGPGTRGLQQKGGPRRSPIYNLGTEIGQQLFR